MKKNLLQSLRHRGTAVQLKWRLGHRREGVLLDCLAGIESPLPRQDVQAEFPSNGRGMGESVARNMCGVTVSLQSVLLSCRYPGFQGLGFTYQ